jgi:hypothetical protein
MPTHHIFIASAQLVRQLSSVEHERVTQFADLLIACHGPDAEKVARRRANKSMARGEQQWAQLYDAVAGEIAKRQPSPTPHN